MLDVGTEIVAAGWAGKDVGCTQVHQAVLAERVTARQNAGNLVFVVVVIVADRTRDLHFN